MVWTIRHVEDFMAKRFQILISRRYMVRSRSTISRFIAPKASIIRPTRYRMYDSKFVFFEPEHKKFSRKPISQPFLIRASSSIYHCYFRFVPHVISIIARNRLLFPQRPPMLPETISKVYVRKNEGRTTSWKPHNVCVWMRQSTI
jgi:hypothetical protein